MQCRRHVRCCTILKVSAQHVLLHAGIVPTLFSAQHVWARLSFNAHHEPLVKELRWYTGLLYNFSRCEAVAGLAVIALVRMVSYADSSLNSDSLSGLIANSIYFRLSTALQ